MCTALKLCFILKEFTQRKSCICNAFLQIFLTANEIHFICGGKCCRVPTKQKMLQAIRTKNQTMPPSRQEPVLHKSLGKGSSVICRILYNQGEKSSPNWPHGGSKNIILCFFANMRYIRDGICTGCIRRWIYYLNISVPIGK